ncbi:hypothetical protein V8E54_013449 [Elaphomyces granulatus]|jgi:hypothetical protein
MHIYSAIFAALLLISPTLADFHIGLRSDVFGTPKLPQYIACPSDYYNCLCYGRPKSDRGVYIRYPQSPDNYSFSLEAGLCGMGSQLNFYYQDNKGGWDFYVNNGDGTRQGTCYSNEDEETCLPDFIHYTDELVCYSHICEP